MWNSNKVPFPFNKQSLEGFYLKIRTIQQTPKSVKRKNTISKSKHPLLRLESKI